MFLTGRQQLTRLKATIVATATGTQYHLNLCSGLIGFTFLEGSHTGENLADEFILMLNHLEIVHNVSITRQFYLK